MKEVLAKKRGAQHRRETVQQLRARGLSLRRSCALCHISRSSLRYQPRTTRRDQNQQLGEIPDLYHRGVDPNTGTITLSFHFPDVARERYAEAIQAIQDEAGVSVRIAPNALQGALAQAVLPAGLTLERNPSLLLDERLIQLRCRGRAPSAPIAAAQTQFHAQTAWRLEIVFREGERGPLPGAGALPVAAPDQRLEYTAALAVARALFPPETGCYKIGTDQ